MIKDVANKTKEQLLEDFVKIQGHNTLECEHYNMAIMVKSAQSIEKSIDMFNSTVVIFGNKSDALSTKVFWLNIILTLATAVGTFATVIMAIKMFLK